MLNKLQQFKGLSHRLELLGKIEGRYFINDSKSTNPDSTIKAIDAMTGRFHLILCGEDKGFDFVDVVIAAHKRAESIIVFGDISSIITTISTQLDPNYPLHHADTIEEAIEQLFSFSKPGDTILFSPSSSSYDQFKGFEDRGNQFCECVKDYENVSFKPDWAFIIAVFSLLTIGMIMIMSTSSVVGFSNYNDSFFFIKRHFIFLILGLIAALFGFVIPHHFYKKIVSWGLLTSVVLLLLTLSPLGVEIGGAKRWLNLAFFAFNPLNLLNFLLLFL